MRKTIMFLTLILTIGFTALAGNVNVRGYRPAPGNTSSSGPVRDYVPMTIPISVNYDEATHTLEITGADNLTGEVFVYNEYGDLENYSPFLYCTLTVSNSSYHTLYIEGVFEGTHWFAEAEF